MATLTATAVAETIANTLVSSSLHEVAKTGLSIIFVYTSHYGSAKIYDAVCVPDGWTGYLQGLITAGSPWCKLTLDFMKVTENHYGTAILVGISRGFMKAFGI